jgi:hypothetical protein
MTGRRFERVTVSRFVVFLRVSFALASPLSNHVNLVILSNRHVRQPRNFRQDYRIGMIGMGEARPVPWEISLSPLPLLYHLIDLTHN